MNYHRVLSRAQWPALRGRRILLQLLSHAFGPTDPKVVVGTMSASNGGMVAHCVRYHALVCQSL